MVTGTDAKGVAAAANLLGADLRDRYAVATQPGAGGDRGARTVRPALAYTPGRSPLHRASPGAAIAYLGSLAAIAFVYPDPIVLVAAGVAAVMAGLGPAPVAR